MGPLRAAVARYGGVRLAAAASRGESLSERHLNAMERAYHRALAAGRITVWAADEFAVRVLGRHPAQVWGEAWWDLTETGATS